MKENFLELESRNASRTCNLFYKKQQPDYKTEFVDTIFPNNYDSIKNNSKQNQNYELSNYNKVTFKKLDKIDIRWYKIKEMNGMHGS